MGIALKRVVILLIIAIAILAIFPSAYAAFTLNQGTIQISANRTGTFNSTFSVTNTGSEISSVGFGLSSPLTDGLQTISAVTFSPASVAPFVSGTTQNVLVTVTLSNANIGQFIGVISASSATEHHEAVLKVDVREADSTPPSILSHTPSGIISSGSTTLSVTTSEPAECKYSTTSGKSFSDMENSFTDSSTYHSKQLTLSEDRGYTYYVKCKDSYSNIMLNDYTITFTSNIPPSSLKHFAAS